MREICEIKFKRDLISRNLIIFIILTKKYNESIPYEITRHVNGAYISPSRMSSILVSVLGLFETRLPRILLLNIPLVVPRSYSDGRTFTVKLSDVCALKRDPGPCPGSALRWYYDAERGTCSQFVYGGCKGNANRFRTLAACQQRCSSQGINYNEEKKRA